MLSTPILALQEGGSSGSRGASVSVGVRGSWEPWGCSYFHGHGMLNTGLRGNKFAGLHKW